MCFEGYKRHPSSRKPPFQVSAANGGEEPKLRNAAACANWEFADFAVIRCRCSTPRRGHSATDQREEHLTFVAAHANGNSGGNCRRPGDKGEGPLWIVNYCKTARIFSASKDG